MSARWNGVAAVGVCCAVLVTGGGGQVGASTCESLSSPTASGSLAPYGDLTPPEGQTVGVIGATPEVDYDGDGVIDALSSTPLVGGVIDPAQPPPEVTISLTTAAGTVSFTAASLPLVRSVGDLNGDGGDELVIVGPTTGPGGYDSTPPPWDRSEYFLVPSGLAPGSYELGSEVGAYLPPMVGIVPVGDQDGDSIGDLVITPPDPPGAAAPPTQELISGAWMLVDQYSTSPPPTTVTQSGEPPVVGSIDVAGSSRVVRFRSAPAALLVDGLTYELADPDGMVAQHLAGGQVGMPLGRVIAGSDGSTYLYVDATSRSGPAAVWWRIDPSCVQGQTPSTTSPTPPPTPPPTEAAPASPVPAHPRFTG